MSPGREPPAPRSRAGFAASCALILCGVLCTLGLVAGWLGATWWVFDLAAHFRVQELAGLLMAGFGLALLRARAWSVVFIGIALLGGRRLLPYLPSAGDVRPEARRLRLASLNVQFGNTDYEGIRRFVRESDADVLLLIEVDQKLLDSLGADLRAFGQRIEVPRKDPFGIALYSRIPMRAERIDRFGTLHLPAIRAEFELGGAHVLLAGIHAPPPITSGNSIERDQVLTDAIEMLTLADPPAIMLGDLNTTPWAESLERLAFPRGWRDAREGQGLLPTWPADRQFIRIPIDHCLLRGPWRVLDLHLGQKCGSDHLGIVVDLALEG